MVIFWFKQQSARKLSGFYSTNDEINLIFLILNMIIERRFTGPTFCRLLHGPVSFAATASNYLQPNGTKPLPEPMLRTNEPIWLPIKKTATDLLETLTVENIDWKMSFCAGLTELMVQHRCLCDLPTETSSLCWMGSCHIVPTEAALMIVCVFIWWFANVRHFTFDILLIFASFWGSSIEYTILVYFRNCASTKDFIVINFLWTVLEKYKCAFALYIIWPLHW